MMIPYEGLNFCVYIQRKEVDSVVSLDKTRKRPVAVFSFHFDWLVFF